MRMRIISDVLIAVLLLCFPGVAEAADQRTFATPADAVKALIKATEDGDQQEMLAIFGDDGKDLVFSGDAVQDKASREKFLKSYKAKHSIVAEDNNTRVLQVGPDNWPMPIPIVNDSGKWRFDTAAGKEELLYRRIGHNELGAIDVCRGYIQAQRDYAAVGHDGLPAGLYAQKLMSDAGKQDGLYWETLEGAPTSPAGPFLAEAGGQGYTFTGHGKAQPYHGYLYRVLKAQGASAKGGAKDYLKDRRLSGGVALVAYPAEFKVSGVMTFIIDLDGVVYQKDLGANAADIGGSMTAYNPDRTWKRVTD
jgi:hypothetical protein